MKLPHGWLKAFVPDLPDPAATALTLSGAGIGVASVTPWRPDLSGVVVGEIVAARPHPNADRLRLCTVDAGSGDRLEIVCGAPNARAGMKAPLAVLGARLPGGKTIGAAVIRGVPSQGMLCSAVEVGKGADQAGLLELDAAAVPGAPYVPDPVDTVLDLEITPNRGDCLSALGVSRQLAAVLGLKWALPFEPATGAGAPALTRSYPSAPPPADAGWSVAIEDPEGCGVYSAILLEGITVAPSPDWMQARLLACGLRPINNVVDITNFCLLELGQPLHAFDAARLAGKAVSVRRARAGEKMKTLDGADHALTPDVLVIADGSGPVAAAGIMGGASSEITAGTKSVLLESAWFDPARIRRGSKALGLRSDSSYRFERGVDSQGVVRASLRAAELIGELAGGKPASKLLWARGRLPDGKPILVNAAEVSSLLGVTITVDQMKDFAGRLGASVGKMDGDRLAVVPPTWRPDLTIPADLAEEFATLYGYDKIPATRPARDSEHISDSSSRRQEHLQEEMAARSQKVLNWSLRSSGFSQSQTTSFMTSGDATFLRMVGPGLEEQLVRLANPLSQEESLLRTSILPGLLRAIGYNLRHGASGGRLFEVGTVFFNEGGVVKEYKTLGIACAGVTEKTLYDAERPLDFYDIKGAVECLLADLGIDADTIQYSHQFIREVGVRIASGAQILVDAKNTTNNHKDSASIGYAWEFSADSMKEKFGIKAIGFGAELLLSPDGRRGQYSRGLYSLAHFDYRVSQPPAFPPVKRDIAIVVEDKTSAEDMKQAIIAVGTTLNDSRAILSRTYLFDVYKGKPVPEGKKSLAFALVFNSPNGTLVDSDVDPVVEKMLMLLRDQYGAQIRVI